MDTLEKSLGGLLILLLVGSLLGLWFIFQLPRKPEITEAECLVSGRHYVVDHYIHVQSGASLVLIPVHACKE